MINWLFSIKFQKLLFRLFIFLLPTQLAKYFWLKQSFIFGIRVDYLAITFYLTDILLLLIVITWLVKLKRGNITLLVKRYILNKWTLVIGGFAICNVLLSTVPEISLMKWLKLLEICLLIIYIVEKKDLNIIYDFVYPLIFSSMFFSTLAILQFYYQETLGGIFYFLGERSFNSETAGIAKVSVFGRDYLRAYSTFAHPNAMAGFMVVVLLFVFQFVNGSKIKTLILVPFFFLNSVALLLTFSKGALIALIVIIPFVVFEKYHGGITKVIYRFCVLLFILFSLLLLLIPINSTEPFVFQRLILNKAAIDMFVKHPLFGVGLNNFIINLPLLTDLYNLQWILQPAHNIYLLILAESGVIGLILFTVLTIRMMNKVKDSSLKYLLLFILTTGLIDHYWLTLQQNILLLAIVYAITQTTSKQSVVVLKDNG